MAHHSEYPGLSPEAAIAAKMKQENWDEKSKVMRKQLEETIGATGKFPEGKLAAHDEGEIAFALGAVNGKVVIEFGKEISSLGMNPEQAIDMAQMLLKKAAQASGDVLTMKIG